MELTCVFCSGADVCVACKFGSYLTKLVVMCLYIIYCYVCSQFLPGVVQPQPIQVSTNVVCNRELAGLMLVWVLR